MLLKIAQTFNEQASTDKFVPTFSPTYHRGERLLAVSKAHKSSLIDRSSQNEGTLYLNSINGGDKQIAERSAHYRRQSLCHPKLGRLGVESLSFKLVLLKMYVRSWQKLPWPPESSPFSVQWEGSRQLVLTLFETLPDTLQWRYLPSRMSIASVLHHILKRTR